MKTVHPALQSLGRRIQDYRKKRGLSQEALADIGRFDRTYVSLIERGLRNPSFLNLCRFATALGLHPSDLIKNLDLTDGGEE
jgi:transcriptional regulator with XRE-family HTH domain